MTASDGRHADAALVRRFRQAQTRRNRTAVFADVVRQHGDAVLGRCAGRLWPDADTALADACDVLIAARLVMADPAKLARPDQLRGWLLAISDGLPSGLPARIDDINWAAVNARAAADASGMRDSAARRASLRQWLERIVATLPDPRQRLFDLFVTRGLDSRGAALELGTSVAEVRRLRRENRQAVLRAFEVTALVAAEAALDSPGSDAAGCGELRQILADAQRDGDRQESGRRQAAVLPAALRVTVARHLSQCGTCQGRRDDCTGRWAPELLPMLAGTELNEQVTEGLRAVAELARHRDAHRADRRVTSVGTAGMAVALRPAAAAGAGLLAALLLLAFVWPGFVHSTVDFVPRDSAPSSHDPGGGDLNSTGAQPVTGTTNGVSGQTHGRQVPTGGAGLVNSLPPPATGSLAAPSSSASPAAPGQPAVQPSTSAPAAQPASGPSPATSTPVLSPSPSATQPAGVPSTPSTSPVSAPPSTTPPPASSSSPSPSPTGPASSTSPSTTASPSVPASSTAPSPTLASSTPSPSSTPTASSTEPSPTLASSTPSPSSTPTASSTEPSPTLAPSTPALS